MQWYVYLVTIAAAAFLGWSASELLGRPIRTILELRRKVLEQLHILENISPPKPRELAVTTREIREYDQAVRNMREAQRIFRGLGFQLLSLGENEPTACHAVATMGLYPLAAGSRLIELSVAYGQPNTDRRALRNQIERALRVAEAAPGAAEQFGDQGFAMPAGADGFSNR